MCELSCSIAFPWQFSLGISISYVKILPEFVPTRIRMSTCPLSFTPWFRKTKSLH